MQLSYVMVKPDGVQRNLVGEVISRMEKRGLKILALKMYTIPEETARAHYAEHEGKPFFQSLLDFITSGPSVSTVFQGKNAVSVIRTMVGATNPSEAAAGTIRGEFGLDTGRNIVHASDSTESAKREISIHFSEYEISEYLRIDEQWLYE
ncbi:MAG: nucleoside-diphosphate kinase [ANME-2 cluster archaeon]|nr:nucleoside-diphosphate kinase [ANME-2 cluster archaeon]MBC2701576.1 nucleoside-diphosphate kinase [ANME-2 cluster archaeon]MBC2706514.1 nucleoside-diphosphate kinase [ANME-2 cluster archaeon]MBC2745851.1 nucleoside-diphosphate kinase [ANME-2 cluster archaeon]MBC2762006.1 nucleoside-diphosphate kinase [ANME-2 cluster archaeon]